MLCGVAKKIFNKRKITSVGKEVEKLEPSDIATGNGKWSRPFRKQFGSF